MPKAKKATEKPVGPHLVFTNGTKHVLVFPPKTYQAAVHTARRHFPDIKEEDLILQTDELAAVDNRLTDIAPEIWESVVDSLSSVSVTERHACGRSDPVVRHKTPPALSKPSRNRRISIKLDFEHLSIPVSMNINSTIDVLLPLLSARTGLGQENFRITRDGARLLDSATPQGLGMTDGDSLNVFRTQSGRKPVIYVYSPAEMDVSIALTLGREWSLSAIYPVVTAKPLASTKERIEWNVRTHLDGSLTLFNTGLNVAYLFWEADNLSPADSVLIPVNYITLYLDKVLLGLGLHTEARTSFITYWLPAFLKHKHVALRFVPQAAYEAAAVLDINPPPDVITRIFMRRRVNGKSLKDDIKRWQNVVGMDSDRAADSALFRVLEWGGMEVLGR
ncbi:hypothetical protein C8F04DRAFT_1222918 [Mycena alexandri]|uniref:Ubiquitin-like domain-containing protein n=1 Tax=Mycena alexandri TaxID=1745969 RepID=A0AAD6WXS8_9AGAR|nr:hypothetical protein C8F04DRAFT_1222918 [Mycena alexandri]